MKVQVNAAKALGPYQDPTCWQNSTLRYVPPVDFPEFLESRLGKAKIMRTWITLDEYWDYRTGITYPDYDIGVMRYPLEELHYPYDMKMIVPAPSGTRFVDYLTTHSRHAQELLLNVRRYEREVSDGIITYQQYEAIFEQAVEYCKALAPNIRYIECCNEVDIQVFGLLSAQEYVNIYLIAHRVVKRLNEKHSYPIPLQLGGFAQAHPMATKALMDGVMQLLKDSPIGEDPMDFYSYHMYNAPESRNLAKSGLVEEAELSGVEKLKKIMAIHEARRLALGLPEKPVFLNELGRARATGLDGDCLHNAAGLITYLIAFAKGDLGALYPFPGRILREGVEGSDVRILQEQLNFISDYYPSIPKVTVDGVYGRRTADQVAAFKTLFNLPGTEDRVNAPTWNAITNVYDDLFTGNTVNAGQFPGYDIS